jgi:succinoglycan biosynthesis transport protein ExoP
MQAALSANRSEIQSISRKEFKLRELQRDVDSNRVLFDTFVTRLKETAATADMGSANARVVDVALMPSKPVKPKKALIVALAAVLALFAGIALTLLLESLSNTFKTAGQVEDLLNLPVLGILPLMAVSERKVLARMYNNDSFRNFSESVRTLRTSVVLAGIDHPQKVLLVTSSIPEEGKSTVSINLAFALGQIEKVLLIDADMRRPTLAKSFEFPVGTHGLANLVAGTAVLEDCIRHVDGIDMISAGTVPPNPLDLLSSPRLAELIDLLKGQYDRIVIDSPPTHAVSDSSVLSLLANAVIYVVKSDATDITLAQKGVGQLLQGNAPLTGVVLNQVDIKKAQGYGYAGYYDYHGYGTEKSNQK